jgi:hypothetical protein
MKSMHDAMFGDSDNPHEALCELLARLAEADVPAHVGREIDQDQPWVRKFSWVASDLPPSPIKAQPENDDELFIAALNEGGVEVAVDFECRAEQRRVRLDQGTPEDGVWRGRLTAPPSLSHGMLAPRPSLASSRVRVDSTGARQEQIRISLTVFNTEGGQQGTGSLVMQFLFPKG